MPTHSAKCKSGLLSHHLYTEPISIYRTDIYTYPSFCYVGKKKITLTHNPFLLILTTQKYSRLHADSRHRSGNSESYGKESEDTDCLLNSNCYKQAFTGLQRKQGKTSASKRDFMFGDLTCVYNSLYKENVLNRLLGAIDKAYGQKKEGHMLYIDVLSPEVFLKLDKNKVFLFYTAMYLVFIIIVCIH